MASSSAPKHDFAPAWLKIPTNAQRPSGAGSGEAPVRREESSNNLNSHFSSKSRNSSVEQRRDRGRSAFSYRHHSIDTDEPQHHSPSYGGGGGAEYRLTASQRQQSGSQPSLGRRPLSRQDFRDNSSPSFSSGNKGFNSYESGSDTHRNSGSHWGRQRSFEHNHSSGNGRTSVNSDLGNDGAKRERGKWKEDKIDKFDKEFPSLKGGKFENAAPATNVANGSVWDTNKSGKIHLSSSVSKKLYLVQKPIRNDIAKTNNSSGGSSNPSASGSPKVAPRSTVLKQASKNASNSSGATSVYHTLMPSKGSAARRPSKDSIKSNGQSSKLIGRPCSPPSQPDVLNARLVTQPRRIGNKNDFLKELRDDGFGHYNAGSGAGDKIMEGRDIEAYNQSGVTAVDSRESDRSHFDYFDYDEKFTIQDSTLGEMQNGIAEHVEEKGDCIHLQQSFNGMAIERAIGAEQADCKALSRSLEAEQRLLREMGWKEEGSEDEGVYAPLTEDEMKEFENLSKQIPKRNGFQRSQHQFTWSPKRVLAIPNALDLENESSGSSSTDSDSD